MNPEHTLITTDRATGGDVPEPLTEELFASMDAYWRAANYLSVGQIYLLDNPASAGTSSGRAHQAAAARALGHDARPEFHLRASEPRDQTQYDLNMIYISGPGHGGPALVANMYLEGTYSESIPTVTQDEAGMQDAVQAVLVSRRHPQPRGAGNARAPSTRAASSGYSLSHAFGAVFDNPDLIVACVVGDGEAETGPLATAWHSNKFLNPATDGAVLPILHLNGYKIANPTVLARIPREELEQLMRGYGWKPLFRRRRRSGRRCIQLMAATLDPGHRGDSRHSDSARGQRDIRRRPAGR